MKPNHKSILTICAALTLLCMTTGAAAQETRSRLRYAFAAGQKLTVEQEESSDDNTDYPVNGNKEHEVSSKQFTQQWEVVSVSPAGDATINVKYSWLVMKKSPAPGIVITLDTRRSAGETNPFLNEMGPQGLAVVKQMDTILKIMSGVFLSRTFTFVVSDVGIVKRVTGFEAAWDEYRLKVQDLIPDKTKRATLDALIEAIFGEDSVHKFFSYSLFVSLPDQPAAVGQEWSDRTEFSFQSIRLPIKRSFRLASASPAGKSFVVNCSELLEQMTPTEEIEFKIPKFTLVGDVTVDPAKGIMLKRVYSGQSEIQAYGRKAPNNVMIMRMTSDVKGSINMSIDQK